MAHSCPILWSEGLSRLSTFKELLFQFRTLVTQIIPSISMLLLATFSSSRGFSRSYFEENKRVFVKLMIPLLPIWLLSILRYFKFSHAWRELPIFSALSSPRELPWTFKLTRLVHPCRKLANISIPTSVSSLKEKSICLTICLNKKVRFCNHRQHWWAELCPCLSVDC